MNGHYWGYRAAIATAVCVLLMTSPPVTNSQERLLSIIFMHHSTGQNLIWQGSVREALTDLGYEFWDHGYNDEGLTGPDGEPTGIDWDVPDDNTNPDGWDVVFGQPVSDPPDNTFSHMLQHDIILFKSCFPASDITDEAMFNAYRQYYLDIRDVMDRHPDKLFIAFTTPPLVPNATTPENAARARRWSEYLTSEEYLDGHPNVAVFNFFDLLADEDGFLREEYRPDEWDSHPNELANQTIGPILVYFVDRAAHNFLAGEAAQPDLETVRAEAAAGIPGVAPGGAPQVGLPAGVIEDFERDALLEDWWGYADPGGTVTCEQIEPGYESGQALQIRLNLPADIYGGCGTSVDAAGQGWSAADGMILSWRSDTPGLGLGIILILDDTPFTTVIVTTGSGEWETVPLRWESFARADWADEGGAQEFDPALVTELNFSVGSWETLQQGIIQIDNVQLMAVDG